MSEVIVGIVIIYVVCGILAETSVDELREQLKKVYRCHVCKRRIRKGQTWCQYCGSNDDDDE